METTMNSTPRFTVLLTLLAVSALLCGNLGAQTKMDWEENAQIGVEINGKIDLTAEVYQPISYKPYMLLRSKLLSTPVLIDLGKKTISKLKTADVVTDQGFAHTQGIPKGKSAGTYTMKGNASVFTLDGKKTSLTVRQTIVGEVTPALILAYNPEYGLRKKNYKPKSSAIKALKDYAKQTEVVVMFATWCSTCKVVLPRALRIFEDMQNPKISVKYIGIAMGGNEPRDLLEKYGHDYPAIIFFQNGKEIDRVIGETPGAVEDLFVKILK